ncbi:MAG: hypothetical protein GW772_09475 [Flavobacteriia bacterium]|nr:hypothetical protein [Flavobacteriia bacterium]OIP48835.1 MAG: hypothetical protein AUK46_00095 [Flavobacteriaceae bacterium CG2_30_31_66]PIV96256.1 MAG: hypothetical protein COW43_08995 [Flavobacteriaceae bacterium CG17_big_fil_post_rev_8_21_14_2_50_31_13]PIX14711.1 MAG: hypothetical protein COZ74_02185 [Flavobacteriaceae bacterium CG_4_8_14_3_um_filter_31_8]PIY15767.1 MAG: hypothetical protein COZ16_02820 [Flavobacteriaceae bacterium CG_4_10_14_3_um_filter_31_253]PIZ10676.1 MAG: hypotheti
MKTYNHTNFFKHTFCEFQQVPFFEFPKNDFFKSKSDSCYFYSDKGVYRKSNHWGKVGNCHWKILPLANYKNQQTIIGFATWHQFFTINSSEKIFFIWVDFENNTANIKAKEKNSSDVLLNFSDAQEKLKKIRDLLKIDGWTKYFNQDKKTLKKSIIQEFLNSSKKLQLIKQEFKL